MDSHLWQRWTRCDHCKNQRKRRYMCVECNMPPANPSKAAATNQPQRSRQLTTRTVGFKFRSNLFWIVALAWGPIIFVPLGYSAAQLFCTARSRVDWIELRIVQTKRGTIPRMYFADGLDRAACCTAKERCKTHACIREWAGSSCVQTKRRWYKTHAYISRRVD